jgi:hypothetical protein
MKAFALLALLALSACEDRADCDRAGVELYGYTVKHVSGAGSE